jgi:cytidyltransferase-like protein
MSKEKFVCVSGYFDPFHVGHLEYLEKAKLLGTKLMVIVNNDHQATLKKGKPFMPCEERCKIISALKCVDMVYPAIDTDRTVCETIASLDPKPDMFCNGGDQFNTCIPESKICQELGIDLVDGLGEKIQSSSWLISDSKKKE